MYECLIVCFYVVSFFILFISRLFVSFRYDLPIWFFVYSHGVSFFFIYLFPFFTFIRSVRFGSVFDIVESGIANATHNAHR